MTRLPFGAAPEDELILKVLQVLIVPIFLFAIFDIPRVVTLSAGGAITFGAVALISHLWFVERRRHAAE